MTMGRMGCLDWGLYGGGSVGQHHVSFYIFAIGNLRLNTTDRSKIVFIMANWRVQGTNVLLPNVLRPGIYTGLLTTQ